MRAYRLNFWHTGATGLWMTWGTVLLVLVVPLAIFWPVHSHEFVLWDDNKTIYENPALRSFTLDHLLRFWRAPHMELYIPCTYMLWAVTAAVSRWVAPPPAGGAPTRSAALSQPEPAGAPRNRPGRVAHAASSPQLYGARGPTSNP